MTSTNRYPKIVKYWLWAGIIMVFFQIVIGGITRLTGSGLSITKWEIVTGTLPPFTESAWEAEFDLYKETPQYAKINEGMSLSEFKFIYFWEYFHRLWARLMGFVFAIPLFFFWRQGYIDKPLGKRLGIIFCMAGIVASFGWIMVASGLIDRPWVNAYKLTMHLSLALILFSYLIWTLFKVSQPDVSVFHTSVLKSGISVFVGLLVIQIILGGLMSGMRAALFYPEWPLMSGQYVPDIVFDASAWNTNNFVAYDSTPFMAALIQTLHRNSLCTGYQSFVDKFQELASA